jgi:hypothetical protein
MAYYTYVTLPGMQTSRCVRSVIQIYGFDAGIDVHDIAVDGNAE